MSGPIVITVPTKYIPINLAPAIQIKTEVTSAPGSDEDESNSSMDEFLVRGKKRRLDHLTWEEKLQRKKLKNRVAAQTSRDRKKAKMEEMEKTIQEQSDQINQLQNKCDSLQQEKDAIYSKYLDLESRFDELQRRFDEQQQQPTTIKSEPMDCGPASQSVGCVSTLLGSAAGIFLNGNTNDAEPEPAAADFGCRRKSGLPVEDNCALPALQDMLEEFDVSKLEELTEILLANVTSDLEESDRGSCSPDAQDASAGGRVPGPVVGTAPERLESGEETDQGSSLILTTHNYSKSPFHVEKLLSPESLQRHQQSDNLGQHKEPTQDTVFGTYDNETNCITIVLSDDEEIPLEEEIICEEGGESEEEPELSTRIEPGFDIKMEPMQQLLSPIPSILSSYSSGSSSLGTKESESELAQQKIFKCPLTPQSLTSDVGYESLGSPTSSIDLSMGSLDEFWDLELFPILN